MVHSLFLYKLTLTRYRNITQALVFNYPWERCLPFHFVRQAFLLKASRATSLSRALKRSPAQKVVPSDVSKPSQLSSFDGRQ
ncbi:hypothetical protein DPMN_029282 [Dreissena polymorpha]|uniref:Uncharacterized protein n=1 Tax=Dreissena polymorpha TaxID=45954 RepID=A0A9D4LYU9_DREPO|nr:hypothetical protein DPMN_029282 [Dreissena polymorpha]